MTDRLRFNAMLLKKRLPKKMVRRMEESNSVVWCFPELRGKMNADERVRLADVKSRDVQTRLTL